MNKQIKQKYDTLIARLKSPENEKLYYDYSMLPSEQKNGDVIWKYMEEINSAYAKLKTQDDADSIVRELSRKIETVHKILNECGWK